MCRNSCRKRDAELHHIFEKKASLSKCNDLKCTSVKDKHRSALSKIEFNRFHIVAITSTTNRVRAESDAHGRPCDGTSSRRLQVWDCRRPDVSTALRAFSVQATNSLTLLLTLSPGLKKKILGAFWTLWKWDPAVQILIFGIFAFSNTQNKNVAVSLSAVWNVKHNKMNLM